MKIVIAGAGAVGTHLAQMLSKENFDIVLIDEQEERLAKLNNDLDIMTLVCSPTSIKGMKQAGIENANLFIAVTPNESENLLCCMLAKQLGAKRTVARIDNYEYLSEENKKLFEYCNYLEKRLFQVKKGEIELDLEDVLKHGN